MIVTSAGYQGDIRLGDTVDVKFSTSRFSSGASFTLAGSPAVAAYVGNGTTEITAGITLTTDFDSLTGLHNVRVVATGGNGYAAGTNVTLVITAGTVDSVSVVGVVVGSFSIENRPPPNALTLKSLNITQDAGSGTAVTIKGGDASGGTAAGIGLKITGGAASTSVGGTSAAAMTWTGGAGAASQNGAAGALVAAAGGTTTVSGATCIRITGTGAFDGWHCEPGADGGYGVTFTGGAGVGGGLRCTGGASSDGDGMLISGVGSGPGMVISGGTTGRGAIDVTGSDGGAGIHVRGGNATGSTAAGHGIDVRGGDCSGSTAAAGHGVLLDGGDANTAGGNVAGIGLKITGGEGAASTNGAGAGFTIAAGGTTTVSGANAVTWTGSGALHGFSIVGGSGGGNALNLSVSGSGKFISDSAIARATFAADTGMQTVRSNTLPSQAGLTAVQIKLDAGASSVNNYYTGDGYYATSGSGIGQIFPIVGYDGSTKIITVAQAPLTAVAAGDTFAICKAVYGSNTIIFVP